MAVLLPTGAHDDALILEDDTPNLCKADRDGGLEKVGMPFGIGQIVSHKFPGSEPPRASEYNRSYG